jgi:hypothetical protein
LVTMALNMTFGTQFEWLQNVSLQSSRILKYHYALCSIKDPGQF